MDLVIECTVLNSVNKQKGAIVLPVLEIEFISLQKIYLEINEKSWIFTSQYSAKALSNFKKEFFFKNTPTCYAVGKNTARAVENYLGLPCYSPSCGEGLQTVLNAFDVRLPAVVWGALGGKSYEVASQHQEWGKGCVYHEIYRSRPILAPLPSLITEMLTYELMNKNRIQFHCGSGKTVKALYQRLLLSGFSPKNPLFSIISKHSSVLEVWKKLL